MYHTVRSYGLPIRLFRQVRCTTDDIVTGRW